MILLQASICWSAGVVSVVQSGPSWLRACARAGADHRAAAAKASIKIERRMKSPDIEELTLVCCLQGWPGSTARISQVGQMVVGQPNSLPLPTRSAQIPA